MANTITGKIHQIGQTVSIPSKNGGQPFLKREIVIDATRFDPYTGERGYDNYPAFEFGGEKCKDLDGYQVGQVVTISFDLQGGYYKDSTGVEKNFTRVRGYKIEARAVATPQPQPQQQPQAAPQQQPQAYQQPMYQQPQGNTPPPPGMNDLPWPV